MDTYEKKIREYLNNSEVDELYKNMLLNLFPELRESEDEKVRKELIDAIQGLWDNDALPMPLSVKRKDEWLAWLEKQGEQKPQRMISAEAKEAMYGKPTWSEEDELVIKDIEEAITNYWHGQSQEDLLDRLKSLKQRIKGE